MPTKLFALTAAVFVLCAAAASAAPGVEPPTWIADNGNGTFSNPLFYDEFSDPDLIRVGDDFYMTGTTMHAMPGLPILRSKDLVNWTFVSYASARLDLGPAYRLEDGQSIYGRGIWAPSLRYHDGTFYIFSNVNGQTTQRFTARDPAGPWTRTPMKRGFHDLSVLFDDDGKAYVVWGYQEIRIARLDDALTDIVPGTERMLIPKGAGMGEGSHFYKFGKTYFILSAEWNGMKMPAARATSLTGPWEVNPAISTGEDFGLAKGYGVEGRKPPFKINPPDPSRRNWGSLHQGAIAQTPAGEWWGVSMYEGNSVGRLTALSPVTWKDGWPYFGLPGNLTRSPRVWVKPKTDAVSAPHAPYRRDDDFASPALEPVWQWNHAPTDGQWSLSERPGYLRLHSLPASDFLAARNSLTQRAVGPRGTATVSIDLAGLKTGDVAGLALLTRPYGWIGVEKSGDAMAVSRFDEQGGAKIQVVLPRTDRIWLRVESDFRSERHVLSYSTDGQIFSPLGENFISAFQLTTFQGVRYALFAFNHDERKGGFADFDAFTLNQPDPRGERPIPLAKPIVLRGSGSLGGADALTEPIVLRDQGLGRVSLSRGTKVLTVQGDGRAIWSDRSGGPGQIFQWIETLAGDISLMSLKTHRYLRVQPESRSLLADSPGPTPDGKDGARFVWRPAP